MKAVSKVIATLAVSALALGMFGCGGGDSKSATQTTSNPDEAQTYTAEEINAQDIVVQKSGFSFVPSSTVDPDGNEVPTTSVNYVFTVTNPNTGYVAQNVPFNITGYNVNGDIVFSGGSTAMFIYPGIETAISGTTTLTVPEGMDTEINDFVVEPLAATVDWLKTGLTNDQIATMFTVSDLTVTPSESGDGYTNVTASITGDPKDADKIYQIAAIEDTLEAHAVLVLLNEKGDYIYGSESASILIDETTTSNNTEESVPLNNLSMQLENLPAYSDYKLFVMPGM